MLQGLAAFIGFILLLPIFFVILVHAGAFFASSTLRRKSLHLNISVKHVLPLPLPFLLLKGIRIAHYYSRFADNMSQLQSTRRNAASYQDSLYLSDRRHDAGLREQQPYSLIDIGNISILPKSSKENGFQI